jgi:hypothetical protein
LPRTVTATLMSLVSVPIATPGPSLPVIVLACPAAVPPMRRFGRIVSAVAMVAMPAPPLSAIVFPRMFTGPL